MPQQLIYTSALRGLVTGRSGHCTVACSDGMREALQLSLEQISYYEHLDGTQVRQPVVCAYRIISIRGTSFHVLSRIVDAGLDFTKRTNFIAHHLVFQPHEVLNLPPPPILFLHWNGWRDTWTGDPEHLRNENWGNLLSLVGHRDNPARQWAALTGDAANAATLLESRPQESFLVDGLEPGRTLPLLGESLALLAVRPAAGNPWQHTFTTFLQERDESNDFRWRLLYSGTAAHNRLTTRGAALKPLAGLRCGSIDEITAAYARSGPQPLEFTTQPQDQKLFEGQPLILQVVGRGIPLPTKYQWYACTRDGRRQPVPGAVHPELRVPQLPLGVSRYQVIMGDGSGSSVESRMAMIQVDRGTTPTPQVSTPPASSLPAKPAIARRADEALPVHPQVSKKWDAHDKAAGEARQLYEAAEGRKSRNMWIWIVVIAFLLAVGAMGVGIYKAMKTGSDATVAGTTDTNTPPAVATVAATARPIAGNTITSAVPENPRINKPDPLPLVLLLIHQQEVDVVQSNKAWSAFDAATNKYAEVLKKYTDWPEQSKEYLEKAKTEKEKKQSDLDKAQNELRTAISKLPDRPNEDQSADAEKKRKAVVTSEKTFRDALNRYKSSKLKSDNRLDNQKNYKKSTVDPAEGDLNTKTSIKNIFDSYYKNRQQLLDKQNEELEILFTNICGAINSSYEVTSADGTNYVGKISGKTESIAGIWGKLQYRLDIPLNVFSIWRVDFTNAFPEPMYVTLFDADVKKGVIVLWPQGKQVTNAATCDQRGHLVITGKLDWIQKLRQLQSSGSLMQLQATYLDISTNFNDVATNYTFSGLSEMLAVNAANTNGWMAAQTAVAKFIQFRKISSKEKPSAQPFWDELNGMCLIAAGQRPDKNGPRLYDFEQSGTRSIVYEEIKEKVKTQLLFDVIDCESIGKFLEDNSDVKTLDEIQDKLIKLMPRGVFDPKKLKMSLLLKLDKSSQNIELVRFTLSQPN